MTDRLKYEKLDDIGVVGQQEPKSAGSRKYHRRKTGEIFRKARAAAQSSSVKSRYSKRSA